MHAIEFLKQHRIYEDDVVYNSVGEMVGTISQLMEEYTALHIHDVVGRSEQFKCGKCNSNWGEVRATCFNCGHESEDLST